MWVNRKNKLFALLTGTLPDKCLNSKPALGPFSVWIFLDIFYIFHNQMLSSFSLTIKKPELIFARGFISVYISHRTILNDSIDVRVDTALVLFWC